MKRKLVSSSFRVFFLVALFFSIFCPIQANPIAVSVNVGFSPSGQIADIQDSVESPVEVDVLAVLDSVEPIIQYDSIMGKNEWKELDCDFALTQLDRTKTSFGMWGLRRLFWPVSNPHEIKRRQVIIRSLLEDEELYENLTQSLEKIHAVEGDLIAYWNPHDNLTKESKQLYYSVPFEALSGIQDSLNESITALEGGFFADLSMMTFGFGVNLGMSGLAYEGMRAYGPLTEADIAFHKQAPSIKDRCVKVLSMLKLCNSPEEKIIKSYKKREPFNILNGIQSGLMEPVRKHTVSLDYCKDGYASSGLPRAFMQGTAGDQYEALKVSTRDKLLGWGTHSLISSSLAKMLALGLVGVSTLMYDYGWVTNIKTAGKRIKFLYSIMKQLQERVSNVAVLFRSMKEFNVLVASSEILSETALVGELDQVIGRMGGVSNKLKEVLTILDSSSCDQNGNMLTYSRGKVLVVHKLLQDVKDELIPVLQAIAELDAYRSIAQLYKELNAQEGAKFCFAEFIENPTPIADLKDFWTPLISAQDSVVNSVSMGGDNAMRMILTGPNGGGKSTIMKGIGYAALFAQSWGIVPARSAQMTLFTGFRTSLNTQENTREGLSTFMAEKFRIDAIKKFLSKRQLHDTFLILLDEPYSGTVESESAYRVCKLGDELANMPYCMVVIATHLKEPIDLAKQGAFVNYHPELIEKIDGRFIRTFKLLPGPAYWWFTDMKKRSRFIDQLVAEEEERLARA